MKKLKRVFIVQLMLVALLGAGSFTSMLNAQSKNNSVKIKVVTKEGEKVVDMDTTFTHDVMVFQYGDDTKVINVDSMVKAHTKDIDKHMRVLSLKMDSLNDFNFEFDGDMEKMHIELERLLKEKGVHMEELSCIHEKGHNRVVFIGEEDDEVDVEEYFGDDGEHVKIIRKEIIADEDGEHNVKTFVITSDSHSAPMHWKSKHTHTATVKVEAIPLEDIAFLKKAGLSSKKLMAEPINIEDIKIKVEKIMENEVVQTLLHIECELPEGSYQMEMINQEGKVVKEDKEIQAGTMKQEFELKKEEAPYYMILSKNNQMFGRKIVL